VDLVVIDNMMREKKNNNGETHSKITLRWDVMLFTRKQLLTSFHMSSSITQLLSDDDDDDANLRYYYTRTIPPLEWLAAFVCKALSRPATTTRYVVQFVGVTGFCFVFGAHVNDAIRHIYGVQYQLTDLHLLVVCACSTLLTWQSADFDALSCRLMVRSQYAVHTALRTHYIEHFDARNHSWRDSLWLLLWEVWRFRVPTGQCRCPLLAQHIAHHPEDSVFNRAVPGYFQSFTFDDLLSVSTACISCAAFVLRYWL
jgi:hypothetical protein